MNSARQQCLFPVYFSRDRKGNWHWIKRASFAFNLSFHTGAGEKSIFIVHVMAVIWRVPVVQYVFCRTP